MCTTLRTMVSNIAKAYETSNTFTLPFMLPSSRISFRRPFISMVPTYPTDCHIITLNYSYTGNGLHPSLILAIGCHSSLPSSVLTFLYEASFPKHLHIYHLSRNYNSLMDPTITGNQLFICQVHVHNYSAYPDNVR